MTIDSIIIFHDDRIKGGCKPTQLVHSTQAKLYHELRNWTNKKFDEVDWEHLELAMKTKPDMYKIWRLKQNSRFCGTRVQVEFQGRTNDVPTEPTYSQAIKTRHAARVKATKDRIDLRLRGLTTEKAAIQAELLASPNDRTLLRELREVEDQMAKAEIDLTDEVDMKLTEDEKISHSNAWIVFPL